jgi:hypothetical protein
MRLSAMPVVAVLALALFQALPAPAAAHGTRDTESTASPPAASARQLALSRRYVDLMQGDQLRAAVRDMVEGQAQAEAGTLPEADRRFLTDLTVEIVGDLVPAMMDELVPVYAVVFTEAELESLVAFYDSAEGRSIITKTFASMPEADAAMMTVIPLMLDKMAVRMCDHYGCDPVAARAEMYAGAGLPLPGGAAAPARRK